MIPELRLAAVDHTYDDWLLPELSSLDIQPGSAIEILLARPRVPFVELHYDGKDGDHVELHYDPSTGETLNATQSHAASGFIFPFHFSFHLPGVVGYWIAGTASIGMLFLLVSGVFIHKKIFKDFFTFRPDRQIKRATLDIHNLSAVIALPFHALFPLTGIVILVTTYFSWSLAVPYAGDETSVYEALYGPSQIRPNTQRYAEDALVSVDRMINHAEGIWYEENGAIGATAYAVEIVHFGTLDAYVSVSSWAPEKAVGINYRNVFFDVSSGAVIDRFEQQPLQKVAMSLEGAHWIQFDNWPLRWLYFFVGLSGCVMIATGSIFWVQARSRKANVDLAAVRAMRSVTVWSLTGVVTSTLVFFIANRLLPREIFVLTLDRAGIEVVCFFSAWAITLVHAFARGRSALFDQCIAIGALAVTAVLLNWITTGHHLVASFREQVWSVHGVDWGLLFSAAIAWFAASKTRPGLERSRRNRASGSEQGAVFEQDI